MFEACMGRPALRPEDLIGLSLAPEAPCQLLQPLLIDLDGTVHAKGVILDGLAGSYGDASRGSRYNAALTYEQHRGGNQPTMIVVISAEIDTAHNNDILMKM